MKIPVADVETIERLKMRAKLHRRSLQGEVKLILENEAAASRDDPWALAERIRAYDALDPEGGAGRAPRYSRHGGARSSRAK